MEREASGVRPHCQRPSPSPHPCSCLRLGPGAKGPVRLGVPGDGLAAEGPSPVLAPGPPAPGPDLAPTSPPCPPDPALSLAHLRDQAGQGPSGPQRPRLQGGEVSALSHEEAVQTRGCPPHGKCLIRGNCSFYRPGSQDVLNLEPSLMTLSTVTTTNTDGFFLVRTSGICVRLLYLRACRKHAGDAKTPTNSPEVASAPGGSPPSLGRPKALAESRRPAASQKQAPPAPLPSCCLEIHPLRPAPRILRDRLVLSRLLTAGTQGTPGAG